LFEAKLYDNTSMTSLNIQDLPNDIESLKNIIAQADKTIQEKENLFNSRLVQKDKALNLKDREIKGLKILTESLQFQLEKHLRALFGRKSEKRKSVEPGQLFLFEDELPVHKPIVDLDEEDEPKEKRHPKRKKPSDKMNLEVVRKEHEIKDKEDKMCGKCDIELKKFGEDQNEEIVYIPATLKVRQHARFKYVCPKCEGNIKSAPKPLQIIPKSYAGVSLLAHIILSKYADHLPLYRQCQIFERFGAEFSRKTLSSWMMKCAALLEPIVIFMLSEILESHYLHTDDTKLPVMAKGKTREGRLAVYMGDKKHPHVYFQFAPNKEGKWIRDILENYSGNVHADACPSYDKVFKEGRRNSEGETVAPATEVGCNAHTRRKFEEAYDHDLSIGEKSLGYYKKLYKIERRIKLYDRDKRLRIRQKESKKIHEDFYAWIESLVDDSLPQSIEQAINYAINHKKALLAYLDDGELSIDNNPAERALRCVAVGRNNWKFVGHDNGGRATAVFYSLIETCKLHKINAYTYIHDALIAMADCRERGDPEEMKYLTPIHWQATRNSVEKELAQKV